MNKSIINYPPEISGLIVRHKGVNQAEKAAGISQGTFGKIRDGKQAYTETVKTRVLAAIAAQPTNHEEGKTMAATPNFEVPETCPPLLGDLLRKVGSKFAVRKLLNAGDKMLNGVIAGQREMPPTWAVKAKVELGQSVIGPARQPDPQASALPEFIPWDNTTGIFRTKAHGKGKARTIKNVPKPLIDLLEKYNGNVSAAARAIGMTGGAIFQWIEGIRPFTEDKQRRVHAAMHGMPAGGSNQMGEQFDKYTTGFAICMLKSANYDRIADIAEILNGALVFKKNTATGWIIMYKMHPDDLPKFKKLAMRDANEIVCP